MDRARMTEMGRFPAVFLVTLIVGLGACNHTLRPRVRAEPIHPDTDAMVVFRGERGEVEGTIDKMRLEVAGQTYERSGESLTVTAGPFATSSNERLTFRVVAVLAGGSRAESEEEWVFVANPRSEAATVLASTSASASDLIPPVDVRAGLGLPGRLAEGPRRADGAEPLPSRQRRGPEGRGAGPHRVLRERGLVHGDLPEDGRRARGGGGRLRGGPRGPGAGRRHPDPVSQPRAGRRRRFQRVRGGQSRDQRQPGGRRVRPAPRT
jgi:hypothetical protein